MRSSRWILILTLSGMLILSACNGAAATPSPAIPTVNLDSGSDQTAGSGSVVASGVIVPAQEAQLSFTIAGRVQSVDVKVGDRVKAGQVLVGLDTAVLEAKVAQAEGARQTAQAWLDYLNRVGTAHEHRERAEGDVAQAEGALAAAQAALAQATLTAPIDGTVVALDIIPGETVMPGQIIGIVGTLDRLQVETTDLSERDAPNVNVGQPATVYVEALDMDVGGKVVAISPMADTIGGDVVYKVTVRLDEQPEGLRWGMSVNVEIREETR
ncbi:MAG: efflux RND transporter periplasmic adaptor subunit [Chloroflexi bacterium]|nr:efflux RND transporter periplasmic adaptor subunit [Chloroflexota bacterium]